MGWMRRAAIGAAGLVGVVALGIGGYGAYALATAGGRLYYPDTAMPEGIVASTDPDVIAAGEYLVRGPAHCVQCHGGDADREHPERMTNGKPLSGGLAFDMGPIGSSWASNLTPDPETGIGRRTDAELARTLRTGVLPDGYLSFFMGHHEVSDADLVAIISYLRSQPPVNHEVPTRRWGFLGKLLLPMISLEPDMTPVPDPVPPSDEPSVARGRYLAEGVVGCANYCHRAMDMSTFQPIGPLAGGADMAEPSHGPDSDMEYIAPNLTSHPTGVTGRLDEDQFVARLRAGRTYTSSIMPWESLQQMTEADIRSIYRYLKSLPPADNDVGPTYRKVGWTPDGT